MRKAAVSLCIAAVAAALSGCSMPDQDKLRADSMVFASQTVESLKPDWNQEFLLANSKSISADDCNVMFGKFRKALGPIKMIGKPAEHGLNIQAGINVPDCRVNYTVPVSCEKAEATVQLTEIHFSGKWIIIGLTVTSPLFKKHPELLVDSALKNQAEKYVDRLAQQILDNWSYEQIEKEAGTGIKSELNAATTIALKGLLSAGKEAGPIDEYEPPEFSTSARLQGLDVYTFYCHEKTNKGVKLDLTMKVAQESGKWRLEGFFLNAHS